MRMSTSLVKVFNCFVGNTASDKLGLTLQIYPLLTLVVLQNLLKHYTKNSSLLRMKRKFLK
jgi:hypothetical protein